METTARFPLRFLPSNPTGTTQSRRPTRHTFCRRRLCISFRSDWQEVQEQRQHRPQCPDRRLAGQRDLPLFVGAANVLPCQRHGLQRAGQFRASCIPAITDPGAVFAQDKGSFDPAAGPLLQRGRVPAVERVQLQFRHGSTRRGHRTRLLVSESGLGLHQEHADGRRNELEFRFEVFDLWNWHTFSSRGILAMAFSNDLASSDFGKWTGSVTDPRTAQLAVRFEF